MTDSILRACDEALAQLGRALRALDYRFVTVTPATHARVVARDARDAADLRDVFGWSRRFSEGLLPPALFDLLGRSGALVHDGDGHYRSAVRFSSLGTHLFVHSAFPTDGPDAVFFGPDTYRYVRLLERMGKVETVFDVGCGSGAGGLSLLGRARRILLGDINPTAIRYARVNAALAGARSGVVSDESSVHTLECDLYAGLTDTVDAIIANPPYLNDDLGRAYRDGGGPLGTELSLRIVAEGLPRLSARGRLLLYTGAPICAGIDMLWTQLKPLVESFPCEYSYEEIDPDVFGEDLSRRPYASVERIAVVSLEVKRC